MRSSSTEVLVSVPGKDRFVVMEVAQYRYLRGCELDAALAQSQADVAAGRFVAESAKQHMERLDALLVGKGARLLAKPARKTKAPAKDCGETSDP